MKFTASFVKQEKYYCRLFLVGVVNGIGDRFSSVAVLALILELTGSGLAVGVTLAIRLCLISFLHQSEGDWQTVFHEKTSW
ncbi:hypothetical protein RCG24_04675 [Neobacillus sp. OS1-32]|uniref:hypothetical protein n=1 Tax=Neobacillus TaxID=2675232 RepID=UPI001F24D8B6|nr:MULTISPECIES: hypothetical protein [Neobacillus]WML31180.1 hypothetical protein RCG24_04675 [Neobacillus sp. OS1-32]